LAPDKVKGAFGLGAAVITVFVCPNRLVVACEVIGDGSARAAVAQASVKRAVI
jgi:hypothetical protein